MAFQLRWSKQAVEDLREIVQFISQDDPEAARSLAERIILRIEAAANFPFAYRPVPEKGDESIREIILKPYRLVYSIDTGNQLLHVVRIWHSARGTPKI
jgi:toxin ParE1/3/4